LTSALDLLINEVANVLGISPDEVKAKFTEDQLKDLLNSVWCEPIDELGIPIDSLEAPCEDLAIPNLLPAIELEAELENILTKAKAKEKQDPTKCVQKIDDVNSIVSKQIDEYQQHKNLLEKLIEYRDNYSPVVEYFKERANETARLLGVFDPLLIEERRLSALIPTLKDQRKAIEESVTTTYVPQAILDRLALIDSQIDDVQSRLQDTQDALSTLEKNEYGVGANNSSLIGNSYYNSVLQYQENSGNSFEFYIKQYFNQYISYSELQEYQDQVKAYSECLTVYDDARPINSIQDVVENSYFTFKLAFIQLNGIKLQKEVVEKSTGARKIEKYNFPIKGNPILQKDSFFNSSSIFSLTEFNITPGQTVTGKIYTQYYNLFEDPVNNFFSPSDRGLTSSINLVDPKLKGTGAEMKREKNAQYYIQNLDLMQDFYQNFENSFEVKKAEKRAQVIDTGLAALKINLGVVARKEAKLLLALGKVNYYLPEENPNLQTIVDGLTQKNNQFLQAAAELDEEIARISLKVEELKPSVEKTKSLLKSYSPECFDKIDQPITGCNDVKSQLGVDPFFTKTLNGIDPTLPTSNQMCYWVEFAKMATFIGLLPMPNGAKVGQLRYWPVGIIIPYPGGLIKIPLPIMWIPLLTISTPLGNIVFFLTINGVFISPVVFLVSNSGFKQHIITVKGPSEKFGYTGEDESIKPEIHIPLSILSAKDKATRLLNESSLGPNYNLNDSEKQQLSRQQTILKAREESANATGNENKKLKTAREKKNLENSTSNVKRYEKMEKIVNKVDSAKDAIEDAKRAILNRLDDLGKPSLNNSNKTKEKIVSRREKLLSQLKEALVIGDEPQIISIRKQLESDGIELSEKIDAIKSDMITYYDRIKFPKIVIPKDSSTIDLKQNAIAEIVDKIREFANIHKTQFFSKESARVKNIFLVQLAKNKEKIRENNSNLTDSDGLIDVDKNPEKVKTFLLKANKTIVDAASGKGATGNSSDKRKKIDDLQKQYDKETDKVKKVKLKKKLNKEKVSLSEIFENEKTKTALALTPEVMSALAAISIDFDPFAPCCKKETFSLGLTVSPALPIFLAARATLDAAVNSLSAQDLKSLFGGKTKVSTREITTAYLSLIKKNIPTSLEIPLPDLNLLSFAKAFSGLLISLYEIKAPNAAAQPALPKSITLDLNLLKKPLLILLLSFLENCLPDPTTIPPTNISTTSSASSSDTSPSPKSLTNLPSSNPNTTTPLDPTINIVTCDPSTTEDTILSDGTYNPANLHSGRPNYTQSSNSSAYSSGNVIINSKKDILPNFQTLDLDFLSVNPGDLLVILKNFIELKFDEVEKLLDPFYSLLNIVKGAKGVNLNLLEFTQHKIPPTGPPAEATFFAITKAKAFAPRSANFKMIDVDIVKQKVALLEPALSAISATAPILAAAAGAADAVLPNLKSPKIDTTTGGFKTIDKKAATFALRQINPLLSQDDVPPWERMSVKNVLFVLFLDEFVATGADQVGFFRSYI